MKQDDLIKGDWRNLNGQLKSTWDKLTDEDLQHPEGDRDYLIDKLQERYGIGREVAAKQVEDFEKARY
ncbi:MAG TPA: CsbD family protein [Rhodanobacteraceae bacterium]|nr:CsbD family protein [Rhodanobacteraceae bacterium]